MKIIGGSIHPKLSESISKKLGVPLISAITKKFSDGETRVKIEESVRGSSVYIIQPTGVNPNDSLMELFIMIDGLKRASASHITAVIPYFGYARQDKKQSPREPITAKLIADFIATAGAHRIITIDVHASQIEGFFDIPVDHLTGMGLIKKYFKEYYYQKDYYGDEYIEGLGLKPEDIIVVSPDIGGVKRTEVVSAYLGCEMAIVKKSRPAPGEVRIDQVIGDVKGKRCLMIDDMADSCSTLVKGSDALYSNGAIGVDIAFTHPVLSGNAYENLKNSNINKIVFLNTLPVDYDKLEELGTSKVKILDCSSVLADTIRHHYNNESVSSLFKD